MAGLPSRIQRASRACAVVLLFAGLTAVMAYPLSANVGSRVINMGADTRLFLWTLGWDLHALGHQPLSTFDANIFFPGRHTLAYSENLLGVALLAAPWLALTGSLLTAMNLTALLSCLLCAVGAYTLARRLGISGAGALVSGVVFAFSPPLFQRLGQLHLISVEWIPFCLAALHSYLRSGRRRDLLVATLLFTIQALCSGHGAVFLALAVGTLLVYHAVIASLSWRKLLADLGPAGLLPLALAASLVWPYVEVKREMGFKRSLAEAADGSPDAASFVASPSHVDRFLVSRVVPAKTLGDAAAYLFPGFLPLFLALLALARSPAPPKTETPSPSLNRVDGAIGAALELGVLLSALVAVVIHVTGGVSVAPGGLRISAHSAARSWIVACAFLAARLAWTLRTPIAARSRVVRWRARIVDWSSAHGGAALSFYPVLALLSLWACLGPRFGLYGLLYYLPGVDFIRIPSRIFTVTLLAVAILAGAGLDRLRARYAAARRSWSTAVVLALLVVELAAFPIKARPYAVEIPEVDRWLARQPKPFVVAEVPVPDPGNAPQSDSRQSLYMIHSMAHWQRTVNGYSGSRPLRHADLYKTLQNFPDGASLAALREWGVTYVVVHLDLCPPAKVQSLEERLRASAGSLQLEHSEGSGRVYTLRPL